MARNWPRLVLMAQFSYSAVLPLLWESTSKQSEFLSPSWVVALIHPYTFFFVFWLQPNWIRDIALCWEFYQLAR